MTDQMWGLITLAGGMLLLLAAVSFLSQKYSLDQIKSKTVGDGQYGSARWATPGEIRKTYVQVPFRVSAWRRGIKRPTAQGLWATLLPVKNRAFSNAAGYMPWWTAMTSTC